MIIVFDLGTVRGTNIRSGEQYKTYSNSRAESSIRSNSSFFLFYISVLVRSLVYIVNVEAGWRKERWGGAWVVCAYIYMCVRIVVIKSDCCISKKNISTVSCKRVHTPPHTEQTKRAR
jgi:hypothetical protein